jgi:hypothetical protein
VVLGLCVSVLVVLESCCVMCIYLRTLAWTQSWCRWPSSYCEQ